MPSFQRRHDAETTADPRLTDVPENSTTSPDFGTPYDQPAAAEKALPKNAWKTPPALGQNWFCNLRGWEKPPIELTTSHDDRTVTHADAPGTP